jgi:hypothetical protein
MGFARESRDRDEQGRAKQAPKHVVTITETPALVPDGSRGGPRSSLVLPARLWTSTPSVTKTSNWARRSEALPDDVPLSARWLRLLPAGPLEPPRAARYHGDSSGRRKHDGTQSKTGAEVANALVVQITAPF